jgi:ribosomal protein S18 acetylase RimI-like enzyme
VIDIFNISKLVIFCAIIASPFIAEGSVYPSEAHECVPDGADLGPDGLFISRSHHHHAFHTNLCEVLRNLPEKELKEWSPVLDQLHGLPYELDETAMDYSGHGTLDMSRELDLLQGKEWSISLKIDTIDCSSNSLDDERATALAELYCAGFSEDDVEASDTIFMAFLQRPIIFLARDAESLRPVGMVWAVPNEEMITRRVDGELSTETVWELHSVCVLPTHPGMGIGSALMRAIAADPAIRFAHLRVDPDNEAAIALYTKAGLMFQDPPEIDPESKIPEYFPWLSVEFAEDGPASATITSKQTSAIAA